VKPLCDLEVADDLEEIPCLRVTAWAEHAHQALGRPFCSATQLLEPNRRVDIVAKYRLPGLEISGEKALDAFTKKLLSVLAIRSKARLHRFLVSQFLSQFGFWAEPLARKPLILQVRRDVRVVEGARLEIALTVCDGVLQISITVATRPIDRVTSQLRHRPRGVEGTRLRACCVQTSGTTIPAAAEILVRRSSSAPPGQRHS
jgi:hypothetical protein